MILLNLFQTGGLTLGLTIVWGLLVAWFIVQIVKIVQNEKRHGVDQKITRLAQFWGAVVVTTLWIVALIIVASDYRGA